MGKTNVSHKLYITLLAGGMGKRMQSNLPKVLHKVNGETMIVRLMKQVIKLNPDKILVVVGKFYSEISSEIKQHTNDNRIEFIVQKEPLGTGDAVKCTLPLLINDNIDNIILNGDVPMIQHSTIKNIYNYYLETKSKLLITSIHLSNPTGCGRIILDENFGFSEIIEEKDCTEDQKKLTLVNCGIYVCNSKILKQSIPQISNNNSQKEYYLTDLVKIYNNEPSNNINLFILPRNKEIEIYNINTKEQLEYIESVSK